MKHPRHFLLYLAVALLSAVPGLGSAAGPRHAGDSGLSMVSGSIQSIDPAGNYVTIRTADGLSIKLAVGTRTAIERNASRSRLAGLTLNDTVSARYRASTFTAKSLSATGPAVTTTIGTAGAVSVSGATIVIAGKTFQTNANTKFVRNGQLVALGRITLRDTLVGHASAGTNVAIDVLASGPKQDEVEGVISAIVGPNVTITPDGGGVPVTIAVGPATRIEVGDKAGTLADLAVGQKVEAGFDPTTLDALRIEVEGVEVEESDVEGTVAAVDLVAGTVTIKPKGTAPNITLLVVPGTRIEVNDAGATLADVHVGMPIDAEYDAATLQARKLEAGGADDEDENEDEGAKDNDDEDKPDPPPPVKPTPTPPPTGSTGGQHGDDDHHGSKPPSGGGDDDHHGGKKPGTDDDD